VLVVINKGAFAWQFINRIDWVEEEMEEKMDLILRSERWNIAGMDKVVELREVKLSGKAILIRVGDVTRE
jgi:hypothetical protein